MADVIPTIKNLENFRKQLNAALAGLALSDLSNIAHLRVADIDGDVYLSFNAEWDGTNWNRIDPTLVAYLLQVGVTNNMVFEGYKAVTLWVTQPHANPIADFTVANGWFMAWSTSEYKDFTVGGAAIEIDGNGTYPYGRVGHATAESSKHKTGLWVNSYAAGDGRDDAASPCWFAGIVDDAFKVQRAVAAPGAPTWVDLLDFDSGGVFTTAVGKFGGGITVAQVNALSVTLGARSFVIDANATTFNSVVAGGGSNNVPVFFDGSAWRIG